MLAMRSYEAKELVYREYVTESLRLIPRNRYLTKGLLDIIHPRTEPEMDAGEIVSDVISRAGLVVKE